MKEIIKRLEIIKTSISIEDEEIIELQIMKLNKLDTNSEVDEIIARLNYSDYSSSIVLIESYIQKYNGLVEYEDKEIQGLKLELKVLETKLQSLSENKDELLNSINEFNIEYNLKLGDIIRDILDIQNEILYKYEDFNKDKDGEYILDYLSNEFNGLDNFELHINKAKEFLEKEYIKLKNNYQSDIYKKYENALKYFEESSHAKKVALP